MSLSPLLLRRLTFRSPEIGDNLYVDGGLYANSPDLIALHEAEQFFGIGIGEIRLLSVGTTTSRFSFSHSSGTSLRPSRLGDGPASSPGHHFLPTTDR